MSARAVLLLLTMCIGRKIQTVTDRILLDMLDNLDGDYEYIIAEGGLNDFWGHSELGEITDGFKR